MLLSSPVGCSDAGVGTLEGRGNPRRGRGSGIQDSDGGTDGGTDGISSITVIMLGVILLCVSLSRFDAFLSLD